MGVSLWHSMSPPLHPCCSSCFSNKNKCSSHSPALASSALAARPLNLPRQLRDPQPQGQRAGGVPMSPAWHPAGCNRAGPPRGSGQPASHEPGPLPNKHSLSGRELPEPAAPGLGSQQCHHRPGVTRASQGAVPGRAGGSAAQPDGTSAHEQPRNAGWLWDGGGSNHCPPAHHGALDPAQEEPPARCQPGSAPRRDPRPGLGEPVGPAGQERAGAGGEGEAAAGEAAVLGPGPGPGGCSEGRHEAPSPTMVQ